MSDSESIGEKWWSWNSHQRKLAYVKDFDHRALSDSVALRTPMLGPAITKLTSTRQTVAVGGHIGPSTDRVADAPEKPEATAYLNAWLFKKSGRVLTVGEVHVLCLSVGEWRS